MRHIPSGELVASSAHDSRTNRTVLRSTQSRTRHDHQAIAAIELLRREHETEPSPLERINLVGPDTLTGTLVADTWSEVLGRKITYGGDNTAGFEENLRKVMPSWMAYDMRLMSERFLSDGMVPEAGDVERLTALLNRPLRSYRAFASEIAKASQLSR